jgi:hypothetical protein
MADMYKDSPAVIGLEPVNEPWQFTPLNWLKEVRPQLCTCYRNGNSK